MKLTTKKFIGGLVIGYFLGSVATFAVMAHFIVNTFGYVN